MIQQNVSLQHNLDLNHTTCCIIYEKLTMYNCMTVQLPLRESTFVIAVTKNYFLFKTFKDLKKGSF